MAADRWWAFHRTEGLSAFLNQLRLNDPVARHQVDRDIEKLKTRGRSGEAEFCGYFGVKKKSRKLKRKDRRAAVSEFDRHILEGRCYGSD